MMAAAPPCPTCKGAKRNAGGVQCSTCVGTGVAPYIEPPPPPPPGCEYCPECNGAGTKTTAMGVVMVCPRCKGEKTIRLAGQEGPKRRPCAACGGSGTRGLFEKFKCAICNGSGRARRVVEVCPKCQGEGTFAREECDECLGECAVVRYP